MFSPILPIECQLLVALRYYATGNSLKSLQSTASLDLSRGTVHNCIVNVSSSLAALGNEFIKFPTSIKDITEIKRGFYEYGGFPAVIGAIDGTVIRVKPPSTSEEAYVGRKDGHAINCQVICDINERFLDAVVRWPGSIHDSTIWKLSGVKTLIEDFVESQGPNYKGWLLGDSGYGQREIMMVPLLEEDLSPKEKRYNVAHKKCRCTVEMAIGVLKSRFRCLCKKTGGAILYQEDTACNIIVSCMVLHNYCRSRNMNYPVDTDIADMMRKESEMTLSRRHREDISEKKALKLGQEARTCVINSFM